jgi:hypothetical protein
MTGLSKETPAKELHALKGKTFRMLDGTNRSGCVCKTNGIIGGHEEHGRYLTVQFVKDGEYGPEEFLYEGDWRHIAL